MLPIRSQTSLHLATHPWLNRAEKKLSSFVFPWEILFGTFLDVPVLGVKIQKNINVMMETSVQVTYLQRDVRRDEDVNADIEFPSANKERIVDVPLYHVRLGRLLWLLRLVVLTLILSLLLGRERERETKKIV